MDKELVVQQESLLTDRGNVFRRDEKVDIHREMIRKHKAWLELIRHEYPSPEQFYRIGVYIRFFNQTKYPERYQQRDLRAVAG